MVAMVLGLVFSMAIYKSYVAMAAVSGRQEQAIELNQYMRVGLNHLAREIRMAGYVSDRHNSKVEAGIVNAAHDSLRITRDLFGGESDSRDNDRDGLTDEADEKIYGDGDLNDNYEDIIYMLQGPNINGSFTLQQMDLNGASDAVIENVDALNFVYLDIAGQPLAAPIDGVNVATTPVVVNMAAIRAIEITLVVRTTNEDYTYTDNRLYRNGRDTDGDGYNDVVLAPPGDNFHRRLLTAKVRCRNLGLY